MGVHGDPKNICPYCLKRFESRQGVKAHQKAKRHRVEDMEDGAADLRAARREFHERVRVDRVLRKARTAALATPEQGER